ncbi:MAG: hypothetical protein AAB225_16540 [Acidobacteriota bacterium]
MEKGGSVDSSDVVSASILAAARRALSERPDFRHGNVKLENEFYELGLFTPAERFAAVDIALDQIRPEDRCGPDPPGNISFPPYGRRPLYAFKWYSDEYGSMMYLKFCLTGTTGLELLVLYSFHKDLP